jgi:hypothetical protein
MSARANYKAYFNAFDEHVQQPKIPDNQVVNSAALKARDTFVLKCDQLLWNNWNQQDYDNDAVNILLYFHPGLTQYFYVIAYRLTSDVIGIKYGVDWRILKVGNNGCPFKIRQWVTTRDPDRVYQQQLCKEVYYRDESENNIKAARVVSAGLRIFNVGLTVSDVIEIKQDHRLECQEWQNMVVGEGWQTDPHPEVFNTEGDVTYGNMMGLWSYNASNVKGLYYWRVNPPPIVKTNLYQWSEERTLQMLNGNISWEDAPYHLVIPSGSLKGLQINAVPITDVRPFRTWNTLVSTQLADKWGIAGVGDNYDFRFDGFTQNAVREDDYIVANGWVDLGQNLSKFYLCNYFYPTVEGEKILDYIADPDFLGTWVHIIQPDPNLEILFEAITNYEILCYPDSIYYTFQSYNEKMSVSLTDVRNLVEETYGNLYSWDVETSRAVSKTIDDALKNNPTFGSSTGFVTNDSNYVAVGKSEGDNDVSGTGALYGGADEDDGNAYIGGRMPVTNDTRQSGLTESQVRDLIKEALAADRSDRQRRSYAPSRRRDLGMSTYSGDNRSRGRSRVDGRPPWYY